MKSATWLGWTFTIAIVVFILALVTPAVAQDTKDERATLAGLTGVSVGVENMSAEAERDGLTRSALQTDVELKLRLAGIPVLTLMESVLAPNGANLYLNVNMLGDEMGLYAYSIRLELKQRVRLYRDPTVVTPAATWGTGSVGLVGKVRLTSVRDGVRDRLDQFINAYLAANPKR
jgi:hypothetical protein